MTDHGKTLRLYRKICTGPIKPAVGAGLVRAVLLLSSQRPPYTFDDKIVFRSSDGRGAAIRIDGSSVFGPLSAVPRHQKTNVECITPSLGAGHVVLSVVLICEHRTHELNNNDDNRLGART